MNRTFKPVIAAALGATAITVGSPAVPAQASIPSDGSSSSTYSGKNCPAQNTFFIGVAGSGQFKGTNSDGTTKGDPATLNMGPTIKPIWDSLRSTYGLTSGEGVTNVTLVINPTWKASYQAASVSTLAHLATGVNTYGASIQSGADALHYTISNDILKCHAAKFVIAGYSQGAMAVRSYFGSTDGLPVTGRGVTALDGKQYPVNVTGMILVGDGYRSPTSGLYATKGGASTGIGGIGVGFLRVAAGKVMTPPNKTDAYLVNKIVEVCRPNDIVCDTGDALGSRVGYTAAKVTSTAISSILKAVGAPSYQSALANAIAVHTSYTSTTAGKKALSDGISSLSTELASQGLKKK